MRLERILWFVLAGAASASSTASLAAQVPATSAVVDTACTYERCSLWLDRGRLVQGAQASIVARSGFFRPLRVLPLVAGDSARYYGSLYERNARRASRLGIAALTLLTASMVVGLTGDCRTIVALDTEYCQDDASGPVAAGLLLGGYTVQIIGFTISSRGHRSLARALWWHNRQYAR